MRVLILSDIHGNILPLEKILKNESYDQLICVGDLVDYGPFPDEVISLIREKSSFCLMGNHDYSLAFDEVCPGTTEEFLRITNEIREYFKYQISSENLAYLSKLPRSLTIELESKRVYFVHSSFEDPLGDYVTFNMPAEVIAKKMMPDFPVDKVIYGHTHQPGKMNIKGIELVNPGSVSFPRGSKKMPSYIIFDDGNVEIKYFEYSYSKLIREYKRHNVPDEIIIRLLGD